MGRFTRWLGASALVVSVVLAAAARAEDKPAKKADVQMPAAVAAAVKAKFPEAKLTSVTKETEAGKVIYDVELLGADGLKYEMDILENGTVMEIERQIKKVPGVVAKAVKAKFPQAKIQEVMKKFKVEGDKETATDFEVTIITDSNKKKEITVSLKGEIKEEPAEKEKK